MSEALENKAVEIIDKSQAAIVAFADKLGEMAKQYGPDVADAALQMARIDAAQHILEGVVCAAGVGFLAWLYLKKIREWIANGWNGPYGPDASPVVVVVVGAIGAGFLTLAAVTHLFNLWLWVGLFEPKLWLAKRILGF